MHDETEWLYGSSGDLRASNEERGNADFQHKKPVGVKQMFNNVNADLGTGNTHPPPFRAGFNTLHAHQEAAFKT
jgi:hypothetical protein